ncbi:hypothetical protein GYMLUDRAFT_62795 [Collybiopsis luxurians FD-317 M1]|uniref:Uncharacterized protein n=1 Tax=Collybiopsis luxurians FD-317 M1 TaxID=944289 RepID=A0A0D0BYS0_9AGAR|nr:hypothetical protein GYMLUDRAFT_62795 [Collybiopsis luxurians FD-317 M1]
MSVFSYSSNLIATSISTFFFGVYAVQAIRCSEIIWRKSRSKEKRQWYLIFTHVVLIIVVTMRSITALYTTIQPALDGLYIQYLPWNPISVLVDSLWTVAVLVSDSFLTYRTYIVWGRKVSVVVISCALVITNFVTAVLSVVALGSEERALSNIVKYIDTTEARTRLFATVSASLNVLNTALISFRIWRVRRQTASMRIGSSDTIKSLLSILIESAAVYTAVCIAQIICLVRQEWLLVVFTDVQTTIIGIVFSSIIINVAQGTAFGDGGSAEQNNMTTTSGGSRFTWPRPRKTRHPSSIMVPVDVEINMETVVDRGSDLPGDSEGDTKRNTEDKYSSSIGLPQESV